MLTAAPKSDEVVGLSKWIKNAMYDFFWNLRGLVHKFPRPLSVFPRTLYRILEYIGGCTIPTAAAFAGKPCLPHGVHGIFISAGAKIGKNCVIFQHVTIGSNLIPGSKGFGYPTVGDNCYIGAGAKIIGAVTIGNNVRIGANAVVHRDVPENSVVTAAKQVVLSGREIDNKYYAYKRGWKYFDDGDWVDVEDPEVFSRAGSGA